MAEKGYFRRVIKNASFEKLNGTLNTVHERSGKSKLSIFLDMAWCTLRYGSGYYDYEIFAFYNLTPAQRNEVWLELEAKYRPWIDFDALPFYGRGAGWQRQLHIYLYPLYYIDYCMAQTVAFQFWIASMSDRQDAWARYLRFADAGGTMTFEELVETAGLKLPYASGCIREIGQAISAWIEEHSI